jgi:hypothetical protein
MLDDPKVLITDDEATVLLERPLLLNDDEDEETLFDVEKTSETVLEAEPVAVAEINVVMVEVASTVAVVGSATTKA